MLEVLAFKQWSWSFGPLSSFLIPYNELAKQLPFLFSPMWNSLEA